MAHLEANKQKLIGRIRRLQGQLDGVIRGIEKDEDCFRVLQTAAACRGAFAGLIRELFDEHIRTHLAEAPTLKTAQREASELRRILGSFLK